MKKIQCEVLVNLHNQLGEGPVWDERDQALYWIDGLGHRWFRMTEEGIEEYETHSPLGSIVLTAQGDLIAGLGDGVYWIDRRTGVCKFYVNPEKGISGNRFNDGKADPIGRYIVGTMSEANNDGSNDGKPVGSLYSIMQNGTWKRLLNNISISNGLCWNAAGDTMYYIDSPTSKIRAFPYDLKTGSLGQGRVCVTIAPDEGIPDGMTIDEEGMLWVAHWGGWCVSRFNPHNGVCLARVYVPVKHVTCCTFGGQNMDELYITTSTNGVAGIEWLKQPHAGALFVARPGVKGVKAFRYGEEDEA